MSQARERRKRELQLMTREAIVGVWQKVISSAASGSTVSVPLLIEQILLKEFPPESDRPKMGREEST